MPSYSSSLANMYTNARPQFQMQQIRPPQMPNTGTYEEGYGRVGEALGKGIGDSIQKAYIDPRIQAKQNQYLMENDPASQLQQMNQARELFNSMPSDLRERVKKNPGFQAKLTKWRTQFPAQAAIYADDSGALTFATKAQTATQMRDEALGVMPPEKRGQMLFAGEEQKIEQAKTSKTERQRYEEDMLLNPLRRDKLVAEEKLARTKEGRVVPESEAEVKYRKETGEAAKLRAEKEETPEQRRQRDLDAVEARERIAEQGATARFREALAKGDAAAKKEGIKAAAASRRDAIKQQNTEMIKAEGDLRKARTARYQAITTNKAIDSIKGTVADAQLISDFIMSTGHLPFFEEREEGTVAISAYGTKQINYAHIAIDNLAAAYDRAIADRSPDRVLDAIRREAESIYAHFQRNDGGGNLLDDAKTLKSMEKIRAPVTIKSGDKDLVIPSDMGTINRFLTEQTGRYFGW
uniref:Uncharacterized protein n=1 Tax=viral metagenome TaxID=1070528 RepID=A0A6M3IPY0_9ZZZZ